MAKAVKPYEKRLRVRGRLSFNPRLTIHFKWLTILCRGCKLLGKFVPKQVQVCWNRECHAGFSQPQGNVKDVVVATLVPQVSGRLKTGPCSSALRFSQNLMQKPVMHAKKNQETHPAGKGHFGMNKTPRKMGAFPLKFADDYTQEKIQRQPL